MARVKRRPPVPLTLDEAVKTLSKLVAPVGEAELELELLMAALTLKAVDDRWAAYLRLSALSRDARPPALLVPQGVSCESCLNTENGQATTLRLAQMLDLLVSANSSRLVDDKHRLFARFSTESGRLAGDEKRDRDVRLLIELVSVLPCFGAESRADNRPYSSSQLVAALYDWHLPSVTPLDAGFHTTRPLAQLMAALSLPSDGDVTVVDPACGSGGFLLAVLEHVEKNEKIEHVTLSISAESPRAWSHATMALAVCADFTWQRVASLQHSPTSTINTDAIADKGGMFAIASNLLSLGVGERGLPNDLLLHEQKSGLQKIAQNELAWVEQQLRERAAADATICIVVPKAVLHREGNEKLLRERLVSANTLESVVLLPEYATKGTKGSSALIMLKTGRKHDRVLFVDGVGLAQQLGTGKLLSEDCIKAVLAAKFDLMTQQPLARWVSSSECRDKAFSWKPAEYLALGQVNELPAIEELLMRRELLLREVDLLNSQLSVSLTLLK